tara:strand:+ start:1057 stop:1320 length:264 start_codon:yes stop_codon:yes gene_type:complete
MVFKIEVQDHDGCLANSYKFNVISDASGLRVWLTDFRVTDGKKLLKRWSSNGDDGSFVNRKSIVIPVEVLDAARAKAINAITFEDIG